MAKRNFRIRHHHSDADPLPTAGSNEYERFRASQQQESAPSEHVVFHPIHLPDDVATDNEGTHLTSHDRASMRDNKSGPSFMHRLQHSHGENLSVGGDESPSLRTSPTGNVGQSSDQVLSAPVESSGDDLDKSRNNQHVLWDKLLASRPPNANEEELQQWLSRVLIVSDLHNQSGSRATAEALNVQASISPNTLELVKTSITAKNRSNSAGEDH